MSDPGGYSAMRITLVPPPDAAFWIVWSLARNTCSSCSTTPRCFRSMFKAWLRTEALEPTEDAADDDAAEPGPRWLRGGGGGTGGSPAPTEPPAPPVAPEQDEAKEERSPQDGGRRSPPAAPEEEEEAGATPWPWLPPFLCRVPRALEGAVDTVPPLLGVPPRPEVSEQRPAAATALAVRREGAGAAGPLTDDAGLPDDASMQEADLPASQPMGCGGLQRWSGVSQSQGLAAEITLFTAAHSSRATRLIQAASHCIGVFLSAPT